MLLLLVLFLLMMMLLLLQLTFNRGVEMMRQLMKAKRTVLYSFEVDVFNSSTINLNLYRSELEYAKKNFLN